MGYGSCRGPWLDIKYFPLSLSPSLLLNPISMHLLLSPIISFISFTLFPSLDPPLFPLHYLPNLILLSFMFPSIYSLALSHIIYSRYHSLIALITPHFPFPSHSLLFPSRYSLYPSLYSLSLSLSLLFPLFIISLFLYLAFLSLPCVSSKVVRLVCGILLECRARQINAPSKKCRGTAFSSTNPYFLQ